MRTVRISKISILPLGFTLASLLLSSCLFSTEPGHRRPRTKFEFSQLQSLKNPLTSWYNLPEQKCLIGLAFAFTSQSYRHQIDSNLQAFADEIGRKPYFAGAYIDLSVKGKNLDTILKTLHANRVVPYITFDPKKWMGSNEIKPMERDIDKDLNRNQDDQKTYLAQILAGTFDAKLKEIARTIREFDFPILLRFAHEMNGDWYFYSGKYTGGGGDLDRNGQADGPQNYIAAWRYVHDLFTSEGASKVVWIYCPNGESFPKENWNRPFSYYPGSKYVDLIASDSYENPEKYNDDLEPIMLDIFNEMGLFWEAHAGDGDYEIRPFGLGEFGTSRKSTKDKYFWYSSALRYIGREPRFMFQTVYHTTNPGMNFSIQGLGTKIRPFYENPRFLFSE